MNRTVASLLGLILLAACPAAHAVTWHVPSQCPTIQAGIDSASAGDTVLVECGTYHEHDIVMKSGVCLRGETGQASCVVIDAARQGQGFLCDSLDVVTRIEGLTIKRAGATWGGGLFCRTSDLAFSNVCFQNNTAEIAGGGIYCCWESTLMLHECEFIGNVAAQGMGYARGGGLYVSSYSDVQMSACVFSTNYCYLDGGALCAMDCSLDAVECVFLGNHVEDVGGGLCCEGLLTAQLTRCVFSDNAAWGGGAVFSGGTSMEFYECAFSTNHATFNGGALRCSGSSQPSFDGCVLLENTAEYGGAIASVSGCSATISDCTFSGNSAEGAAGVECDSYSSCTLTNVVIASSEGGRAVGGSGVSTLSCCDLFGNTGGDWVGGIADQYGINGNFSECPLFCDPENGDFHLRDCSPCAPGNHPQGYECGLIGAFDVGCDCGLPSRVHPTSWSSLKALYR
jgi:hypothetical protein